MMVSKFRAWDKNTKEYFHVSELWNSGTDPDSLGFPMRTQEMLYNF